VSNDNPNSPGPLHDGASNHRQEEPDEQQNGQPIAGKEIDEFFQRLPGSFRWPKPNAEAVAAAVEAIQRISGSAAAQHLAADGRPDEPANCSACGGSLPGGALFCVWCGVANEPPADDAADTSLPRQSPPGQSRDDPSRPDSTRVGGQHHFHHHYHHFVPGPRTSSGTPAADPEPSAPRGRAPGSPGIVTGGRAEATARQVVQNWAQACNTRHIDDLLELYSPDATLIRSSVPPIRSLPAIREFLVSLLEAGLGDVEMESLRVEIMGDIALDLGRCKMLVPVVMGKRREERGKYLVVLVKQPAGTWKILADCWSSDLAVGSPIPEPDARK
jgi:ketosteroid isomerase-like protein